MTTIASLCSGYGGLDMAVREVLGGEVAWFAEIEPRAAAVFAAHHSGIPNLGDLTTITDPPSADILTGGFPCQPVSSAGARKGTDDERWLFDDICALVGRMDPRPRLLIFENVRGLLTANDGDAMARVVHGLARLGYVGSWRLVRASDVGAPHQRARVFIVAHADGGRFRERAQLDSGTQRGIAAPQWHDADGRGSAAADAVRAGTRRDGGAVPRTAPQARRTRGDVPAVVDGRAVAADTDGFGLEGAESERVGLGQFALHGNGGRVDFGPYTAAVERWERILGRPAPHPAPDGRLSATFVEWMMGLPAGWVTDVEPNRSHALRILGNGVVPQQAAHALRLLLTDQLEVAA